MPVRVILYGGFHDDPGSRRRFRGEAAKLPIAPRLVAVEWEQALFERFRASRPIVEDGLIDRWPFLTSRDRHELSEAVGWEGDTWNDPFPGAAVLWLEEGFQGADLERKFGTKAEDYPLRCARALLGALLDPMAPSTREFFTGAAPTQPTSTDQLVSRVSKRLWDDRDPDDGSRLDRDARWANRIVDRVAGWQDGLVVVLVGWTHADPSGPKGRLRGLLESAKMTVESIRLDSVAHAPG